MEEIDTDALRDDAQLHWQVWAQDLSTARTSLDEVTYSAQDFSLTMPGAPEFFLAFLAVRTEICGFLANGEGSFTKIASKLLATADTYEEAELQASEEAARVLAELEY